MQRGQGMALQNVAIFERCRPVRPLRFDDLCTVGCGCAALTPAAGAKAKLGDRALAVMPAAVAPAPEAHPMTSCSLPDELRWWNPSPKPCQRTAACGRRDARGKCCRRCGRACAAPGAGRDTEVRGGAALFAVTVTVTVTRRQAPQGEDPANLKAAGCGVAARQLAQQPCHEGC
jgi:hypothetical protein